MKKMRLVLSLLTVLCLGLAFQANAGPVTDPTIILGTNQLGFWGAENGYAFTWASDSYGYLPTGTVFAGVMNVTNLQNSAGLWTNGNGGSYLTTVFAMTVTGHSTGTGITPYNTTYYLSPYHAGTDSTVDTSMGSLSTIFGANTQDSVMKIYKGTTNYTPDTTLPIDQTAISTIATGTDWADFGFAYGDTLKNQMQMTTGNEPNQQGFSFATFYFDLTKNTSMFDTGNFYISDVYGSLSLAWSGENKGSLDLWQVTSGQTGYVVANTPEPATMLIMGSGLLGLYGLRRRQKKS